MILSIISHAVAAMIGGGGVFVYLHKHQTAAIAAATTLAADVAVAKSAAKQADTIAKDAGV